eukprot:1186640-Prorocentrum_minimum.AAC.3
MSGPIDSGKPVVANRDVSCITNNLLCYTSCLLPRLQNSSLTVVRSQSRPLNEFKASSGAMNDVADSWEDPSLEEKFKLLKPPSVNALPVPASAKR